MSLCLLDQPTIETRRAREDAGRRMTIVTLARSADDRDERLCLAQHALRGSLRLPDQPTIGTGER
jgi:hypothetical protein